MRPLMTLWHQQERVRPVWITLALLAVATAIRMALTLVWGTGYAFLTYYPVIMLSTLVGGWQQGVIATALATLLSYSLFFDHPLPVGEVVVLAMFVSVNLLMVTAAESLLRARRKAEQVSLVAEFREHEVRRQLEDREKTEANLRNMRLAALNLMEDAIEARNTSEESATFLRESEERLRLALSAARLAAWDWNIQTDEVIWNDEHFLMLGYPVGSVTPSYQAWASRVHVEDLDTAEAGIRRSMATGKNTPHNTEWFGPMVRCDGLKRGGNSILTHTDDPFAIMGSCWISAIASWLISKSVKTRRGSDWLWKPRMRVFGIGRSVPVRCYFLTHGSDSWGMQTMNCRIVGKSGKTICTLLTVNVFFRCCKTLSASVLPLWTWNIDCGTRMAAPDGYIPGGAAEG